MAFSPLTKAAYEVAAAKAAQQAAATKAAADVATAKAAEEAAAVVDTCRQLDEGLAAALRRGDIRLLHRAWVLDAPGQHLPYRQVLEERERTGESPLLGRDDAAALDHERVVEFTALSFTTPSVPTHAVHQPCLPHVGPNAGTLITAHHARLLVLHAPSVPTHGVVVSLQARFMKIAEGFLSRYSTSLWRPGN